MIGTYEHVLIEGADEVSALFFYSYIVDESGDYYTPNGGAVLDINKVVLTDGKVTIDITSCVEEFCRINLSDIEDKITENIN